MESRANEFVKPLRMLNGLKQASNERAQVLDNQLRAIAGTTGAPQRHFGEVQGRCHSTSLLLYSRETLNTEIDLDRIVVVRWQMPLHWKQNNGDWIVMRKLNEVEFAEGFKSLCARSSG